MNSTAIRRTKRQEIQEFFSDHVGQVFKSYAMHAKYGSAFRTRVSEINADESAEIVIRNKTVCAGGLEMSVYWSEYKQGQMVMPELTSGPAKGTGD